jgi:hypothetical protein
MVRSYKSSVLRYVGHSSNKQWKQENHRRQRAKIRGIIAQKRFEIYGVEDLPLRKEEFSGFWF